tara:strand:+ start:103 stop:957 length:855 start_codon:yes stop_codon:yes gene_type:complete
MVNLNKVNMSNNKNETVKNSQTPFEIFTDKNANLKRYLSLALKNTREIMRVLLPKIAVEVEKMINFHLNSTKNQVKTDKSKSVINEKAIREHLYNLVGYVAKEEKNGAFETVVYRAINLGKMKVDTPDQIEIDDKNSKIFMVSKVATPFIEQKLKGQKGGTKKVPNESNDLVEVNTGTIDTVYKIRSGKISKGSSTKDTKMIANNFKAISKAFFVNFDKAITLANKKDVKFFDMIDESVWQNLSNTFTLFNSKAYQDMRNFSEDYEVSINGTDVIKKDKSKKIA